jgi:hypothetical protein
MLIGYIRVSKSDGTQTLAPQRDAMLAAARRRLRWPLDDNYDGRLGSLRPG